MTLFPFILLIFSIVSFYITHKRNVSIIIITASILGALLYHFISVVTLPFIFLLGFFIYIYYNIDKYKMISFIIITLLSIAFTTQIIPGFHGYKLIDNIQLSSTSAPYSIWLGFDKIMIAVLFIILAKISFERDTKWLHILIKILKYWLFTLIVIVPIAFFTDYLTLDIKLPPLDFMIIWSLKMLFFTVLAEEIFFRYFLLNAIRDFTYSLKYKNEIALIGSSVLFGIAHFSGGIHFVFLAFIAGLFYGAIYMKTNKIEAAILLHFSLNLSHLLLFSYPYSIFK